MAVVYLSFDVSLHGLNIRNQEEVDRLKRAITAAITGVHPGASHGLDSGVSVVMIESAGSLANGEIPK